MPIDNNVRLCYNGRRNNEKNKDERFRHVFQQQRNRESRGWSERPSIPSNGSVTKLAVPRSAWIIRRQRGGWAKYIDDETNERRFLIKRENVLAARSLQNQKRRCVSHIMYPKIINDSWAVAPHYGATTHRHPSSCVSNSIRDLARVD